MCCDDSQSTTGKTWLDKIKPGPFKDLFLETFNRLPPSAQLAIDEAAPLVNLRPQSAMQNKTSFGETAVVTINNQNKSVIWLRSDIMSWNLALSTLMIAHELSHVSLHQTEQALLYNAIHFTEFEREWISHWNEDCVWLALWGWGFQAEMRIVMNAKLQQPPRWWEAMSNGR